MRQGIYRIFLISFFVLSNPIYASEYGLLIAYPSTDPEQDVAYTKVIEGIEKRNSRTARLEIPTETTDVQQQLDQIHPNKVIALGKMAINAINKTSYRQQMLAGLSYFQPSEYSGVSLMLDSRSLTAKLSRLVPFIKRVFVLNQAGLQTISPSANPNSSPKLIMREGSGLIATIRLVAHVLMDEATTGDAVLVPADLPNDMFYELSEMAWDRNIMLLSTNLYHLENGALMVFFPDEVALGEQLGQLVNKKSPVYENVKAINVALNRRVAQHLNVKFDPATLDLFTVKIK